MSDESRIDQLSRAIEDATKAKKWHVVKALNLTLRAALDDRRRSMSKRHKDNMRRAVAAQRAGQALEEKRHNGPLLAAFASDDRFKSLRGWCAVRDEDKSEVSAASRGLKPMSGRIWKKIRKDFPELEWQPVEIEWSDENPRNGRKGLR